MTLMLASVQNRQEAEIALQAGADIIDLKDPARGALGSADIRHIVDVVGFVSGKRLVSAACGEFSGDPAALRSKVEEIASAGVDFIKIGFLPSSPIAAGVEALADIAGRKKLIAVLFADHRYEENVMTSFAKAGFYGIMLDTDDKSKGRLLDHMPPDHIPDFVAEGHRHGLMVGLAGSLEAPDIPRLLPSKPDYLGFRGALCEGLSRNGDIDAEATAKIRALIPGDRPAEKPSGVDLKLLAARGYFPGSADEDLGTDQIFVRDFVLPVHIGAYSFEHGKPQKVRFDVTADVLRVTRDPKDMHHIVSYDLIMDGIRAIIGRGHVDLVETLVEQIAAFILENPRVARVVVRVEKLELGPGGVGVQIERKRESARSSNPLRVVASGDGGRKVV
ncbi:(5-formylfuran-3-yl)methyl phosphate synthase [Neorhizobium sp. Rsf11]|uniref:(5-formylfuran-3-yl)methyl phosphate synthase n=2 Tax=Neorhizobium TaxID=1525371 RepID=A0ABV0M216_9HYPH|nr:(5-formylfuran-3-yl)methyl phosphate synthase [Neorhizobium petrolearium]MCC2611974.1 dihydroneopterin aldolase [Neorhizobium petrolearium]WGI67135.1 (5-formylfuran-3-yl)methyl phosphate synthase [Neorhizobium petrolearium]